MEFATQNRNKTVMIVPASFKDACNLRKTVAKYLPALGIKDTNIFDIPFDKIFEILVNIDSSDDFEKAVMECLKVCIYDKGGKNLKITPQLFDDIPEVREDYYEIIIKCLEENLRPFLKSLVSEFNNRLATVPEDIPEQA